MSKQKSKEDLVDVKVHGTGSALKEIKRATNTNPKTSNFKTREPPLNNIFPTSELETNAHIYDNQDNNPKNDNEVKINLVLNINFSLKGSAEKQEVCLQFIFCSE